MADPSAQRTLVKSPPELWAEVSDAAVLARHLGEFGEIRITRLEPETTVAWEGDRARGTVQLEASGWGTKVTLTAEPLLVEPEPVAVVQEPAPEPELEPEPLAVVAEEPAPVAKPGFWARLFGRGRTAAPAVPEAVAPAPEPAPVVVPEPPAEPVVLRAAPEPAIAEDDAEAVLVGVLDVLGAAHHRPFSRG